MPFVVLVPARLASTRLPRKALADIGGVPMIVRVARRAATSRASRVVVAADDAEIVAACATHGIAALLTSPLHATGSDRIAEASAALGLGDDEIVVNVQGDEPLLDPALMNRMAVLLRDRRDAAIATACHPITDAAEAFAPNVVKVVLDARGYAMYFSRATIPWARDAFAVSREVLPAGMSIYRHYGLYAYRTSFLRAYPHLAPSPVERIEALEQLRALWHGFRIAVDVTHGTPAPGIDTPEDLARVQKLYESGGP